MVDKIKGGEFESPEAIDAKDIRDLIDNPFELPLLDKFLGDKKTKDALLVDASIDSSGFGEFAIMEFNGSGKFRSNAKAVVDQVRSLLAMNPDRVFNGPVKVHPCVKNNKSGQIYFSLLG